MQRTLRWARRLLLFSLIPGALVALAFAAQGARHLPLPYETTRPEAFVLNGVDRVASGERLYGDLGSLPFVIHVYNPLTYLPTGLLAAAFDLDLGGMLLAGRILSYGASLLLAGMLALWVARRTGSAALGVLFLGGIFFYQEILLSELFRLRPESPGLLFTFAGVLAVLSGRRHALVAAAVLFFVAFGFKQSFVSAPVAAFLFLLGSRRWRDALRFAGTLGALLVAFALVAWLVTGTRLYECTIVSMAANEVLPFAAAREWGPRVGARVWSLALATPLAAAALLPVRRTGFLFVYLGVVALSTFWSSGKHGASLNYFAELGVLSLLVVTLSLRAGPVRRIAILQLLVLALLAAHVGTSTIRQTAFRTMRATPSFELDPWVARFGSRGPLLTTNERLAVHARSPEVIDWFLVDDLARQGLLDPKLLFARVAAGHYDFIVLEPRAITGLETYLFRVVAEGPYRRIDHREDWMRMYAFVREPRDP